MGLSVIVITRDEEANIAECLESVSFADEIVVLDSASTDRTREIAEAHGARVELASDWPGFGPQKNRALGLATQEWVLSIDADERLTPDLADEIRAVVGGQGDRDAYAFPRLTWYCGRFMRHSGTRPDYVLRLFRRGRARFSDHLVHERLLADGPTGRLKGDLLHYSFRDFSQVLAKVDAYSSASAEQALAAGKRATVGKALRHGFWAFFRTYVLKAGFLDGGQGLALAVSNAEGTYYRYLKLWHAGSKRK